MRKKLLVLFLTLIVCMIIFTFFAHYQIARTAKVRPPENIAHLVILGAKVNGTELSLAFKYRADAAIHYLKNNPETTVIATGGKGPGEDITEAEAVKKYLLERGIEEKRIILETKSTSTYENLQFAKNMYHFDEAIIVSNDFHLFRAIKNAELLGIKAYPLAARTPETVKIKLYLREYAAILRLYLFGK